jgi:hypothetical protein
MTTNRFKEKGDCMKSKQIQNYQMLTRVVEFTTHNVSLFPKTSAVGEILTGLKSTVSKMSEQASAQAASDGTLRQIRTSRATARESLTRRLMLSEQVALALNSDKFPMPARRRDHDLISSGRAFVENGASLSKEFSRHALPLSELAAAVEVLVRANFDYTTAKANRASAIREFGSTTMEALGYLQRLDAIIEMTLSDNPSAIASWTVARAVPRVAARKRRVRPPDPAIPQTPPDVAANSVPIVVAPAA